MCYSTPEAWNMTFLCHVGEERSCVYISVYMCRDMCLCLLCVLWKDWVLMSQCFVWWERRVRGWRTASARPTLSVPLFTLCVYSLEGLSLSLSLCLFVFLFIHLSLMFSPFLNMIMHSKGTRGTVLSAGVKDYRAKTLKSVKRAQQLLCLLFLPWSIGNCVLVAFCQRTTFFNQCSHLFLHMGIMRTSTMFTEKRITSEKINVLLTSSAAVWSRACSCGCLETF